ncbi:DUF5947 family protein [Spirillospora sp. NPDC048824]|uniref:DUF5947 family protein n=1 Tax=Spirillospora sp. NPDC048824 TaxID=3364526 RepID=UPI00371758D6
MTSGLCTPRLAALAGSPSSPSPAHAETAGTAGTADATGTAGPAAPAEKCELCAEPLHDAHRHLLDLEKDELLCACGACAILFDDQSAGGRHYRLIPAGRRELTGFHLDGPLWAALGVPVDLAFFSVTALGEVSARYPSLAGALHATVHPDSWRRLVEANPVLEDLRADVEALVVHRAHPHRAHQHRAHPHRANRHRAQRAAEHWILPIDDCYRLTALLREHWTGFGGGDAVWDHISGFFEEMRGER